MVVTGVSSPGDEMVRRWPHVTLVGALRNQVPELHRIGRPALVCHEFNSRFTIVPCCGNGKV